MNKEDYNKYYIQGSDHYLIPKDVFMELFNEMSNWKEENKILRENVENNDKVVDNVNWENMLLKKENKQLSKKVGNDDLISKINLTPETATIQASKVNINGAEQTCDILLKSSVEENKKLKDKLSKIETLIINHNCDTGDIYYKYNNKFLKSELKQRILEIVYEEGGDSN